MGNENEELIKRLQATTYWEDYYTGVDAVIMINGEWVADTVTIQYSLVSNKSPLYGYMSTTFDAVAKGTEIVQGQLTIAFTEPGYLYKLLSDDTDKSWITGFLDSSKDGVTIDTSPLHYAYDSKGIDPEGFKIVVNYGDPSRSVRGGTAEVLNGVHLTSVSKVLEPTGEPIVEVYSFFANNCNKVKPLVMSEQVKGGLQFMEAQVSADANAEVGDAIAEAADIKDKADAEAARQSIIQATDKLDEMLGPIYK